MVATHYHCTIAHPELHLCSTRDNILTCVVTAIKTSIGWRPGDLLLYPVCLEF